MTEVQIWYQDAFNLPLELLSSFHFLYTDPPYSEHVHANATSQSKRRGTRKRDLGFQSITRKARAFVGECASRVQRWSLVYSDNESANLMAIAAQARGAEYVRTHHWIRWSMPQLSGDRPPQGSESVVMLHRSEKGKPVLKHWNGPGNFTHFDELALRGEGKHKCEKPLDQVLRAVSYFSDPGEYVLDPFSGSGTIALACLLLGRNCLAVENDPAWAQKGSDRLALARAGQLSDRDRERAERWLAKDDEPVSAQDEGPSVARAAARARDKEVLRKYLTAPR